MSVSYGGNVKKGGVEMRSRVLRGIVGFLTVYGMFSLLGVIATIAGY